MDKVNKFRSRVHVQLTEISYKIANSYKEVSDGGSYWRRWVVPVNGQTSIGAVANTNAHWPRKTYMKV